MPKCFGSSFTAQETTSTHSIVWFTYHFSRLIGLPTSARMSIGRKQAKPTIVLLPNTNFFQSKNNMTRYLLKCSQTLWAHFHSIEEPHNSLTHPTRHFEKIRKYHAHWHLKLKTCSLSSVGSILSQKHRDILWKDVLKAARHILNTFLWLFEMVETFVTFDFFEANCTFGKKIKFASNFAKGH